MITVNLSYTQLLQAVSVGSFRYTQNLKAKREDRHRCPQGFTGLNCHIVGALGELAVARHLNCFWPYEIGRLNVPDVGVVQVRSTDHPAGSLIVHEDDIDAELFYLCLVNEAPKITIAGTMYAKDAKQKEFWRNDVREPAFFVPQHRLAAEMLV